MPKNKKLLKLTPIEITTQNTWPIILSITPDTPISPMKGIATRSQEPHLLSSDEHAQLCSTYVSTQVQDDNKEAIRKPDKWVIKLPSAEVTTPLPLPIDISTSSTQDNSSLAPASDIEETRGLSERLEANVRDNTLTNIYYYIDNYAENLFNEAQSNNQASPGACCNDHNDRNNSAPVTSSPNSKEQVSDVTAHNNMLCQYCTPNCHEDGYMSEPPLMGESN